MYRQVGHGMRSWRAGLAVLVLALGPAIAGVGPAVAAPPAFVSCPAGDYENVDHTCVPRPQQGDGNTPPPGATAQCRDGEYSFSRHRRGTCSGHGGVDHWLVNVPG